VLNVQIQHFYRYFGEILPLERFLWILLPAGRFFLWKGYLSEINIAFFLYVYTLVWKRECSTLRRKKRVALDVIDTKPLKRRETLGNKNFTQDISQLPFLSYRLPATSVNETCFTVIFAEIINIYLYVS